MTIEQKYISEETRKRIRRKFYGHNVLFSKYDPQIPESAEREYIRLVNEYMRILKEELEKSLPELKEIYKKERDADIKDGTIRADSAMSLFVSILRLFSRIKNSVSVRVQSFGLAKKLSLLSNFNMKMTTEEWARAVKNTLGIDIRKDYYLGDFYKKELERWVAENVDLIKTIPDDTLDKMRDIVLDGYNRGRRTTDIAKDIQRVYSMSRKHAQLIARDQTAKLNGEIQRAQQQDAGITKYIWCDCGDERVRRSHRELNGKIFSWDDPPENSDGRKCHPGQDYQCRCIGRPVFDSRTLNLPVDDGESIITIR